MAKHKKWTDAEVALLGTNTDKAIAEKLGRNKPQVTARRRLLGIPPFVQRQSKQRKAWSPGEISLLGKIADTEVAKRLGVDASAVYQKRRREGIPAYRLTVSGTTNVPGWPKARRMDQAQFFLVIKSALQDALGGRVTLRTIAKLTYYSESRLQKWAAPGTGQEPLSMPIRHHIWLAAKFPKGSQ